MVARCAEAAKEAGADTFLAVGGGSVMDTAKAANALFTHGGTVRDCEGILPAAARARRAWAAAAAGAVQRFRPPRGPARR